MICNNCENNPMGENVNGYQNNPNAPQVGQKSWLIALLLCLFGGYLGLHSFYVGKIGIGVAQLLTGGGCGIWTLVDLIRIIMGQYNDSEGKALKRD